MFQSSIRDLLYGVRLFRRDAVLSGTIVLVLALGIGGSTAVFTLLKAAFLDPLPFRASERLITIIAGQGWNPSISEFREIRGRSRVLQQMAFLEPRDMQVSGTDQPARVFAARVTASFFPLLGVNAAQGRTFLEEENQPGRSPAVVATDAFWRSHFNADPKAVGRTLRLDGQPVQIVGILPAGFHFDYPTLRIPEPIEIFVSYPMEQASAYQVSRVEPFRVLARLRDGAMIGEASSELRNVSRILEDEHPESYRDREGRPVQADFRAVLLRDAIVGTQRGLLWLLLSSSAILLLIACANVSQLLMARALRRSRELAVRASLGATRSRLVRQFLMEGLVLAGAGGTAGLFSAPLILGLLLALPPQRSPLLESARLDLRVVGFTAAVSLMSVIVFAVFPALKSSRWAPGSGLNARRAAGEGNRWRHAMIAFEAALSVFLLCGAGLLAQNLWALKSAPIGFDPANVVVMQLKLPTVDPGGLSPESILPIQEYLEKISALPGVDSAATVTGPPLRRSRAGPTELVGVTDDGGGLKSVIADIHIVSPEYFQTLRIPLIAGRTFRADDRAGRPRVAIVNEEFANRFGLGRDVIGRQSAEPGEPLTIVGMVGNVRTRGLRIEPDPEVYLSSLQFAWSSVYVVVRTTIPLGPLVQQIRATLMSVNRDQAVHDVRSMDQFLADAVTEPRFNAFLTTAFALLALAMVGTGMYSVISYLVSQRTNEIAIRIALGASRRRIVGSVVGKTGAWVIAGLAVGVGLGLATRSTVRSLSNAEVGGSVSMYVSVAVLFFVVTLIAAYAPVRRALRLAPGRALSLE